MNMKDKNENTKVKRNFQTHNDPFQKPPGPTWGLTK